VTRHLFPQKPFQQRRQDPIIPSTTDERLSNLEPQTPEGSLSIPFGSCHRYTLLRSSAILFLALFDSFSLELLPLPDFLSFLRFSQSLVSTI
jgi:hypothetical protein